MDNPTGGHMTIAQGDKAFATAAAPPRGGPSLRLIQGGLGNSENVLRGVWDGARVTPKPSDETARISRASKTKALAAAQRWQVQKVAGTKGNPTTSRFIPAYPGFLQYLVSSNSGGG